MVYDARIHNHKKIIESFFKNIDFFELKFKINFRKKSIVREDFISNEYSKRTKNIEGVLIFEHGEIHIKGEEKVNHFIESDFLSFNY